MDYKNRLVGLIEIDTGGNEDELLGLHLMIRKAVEDYYQYDELPYDRIIRVLKEVGQLYALRQNKKNN